MSNPAVTILSSCTLSNKVNFRVEDNIGECIHLHLANLRFDLTINEVLKLYEQLELIASDLIDVEGFNIKDYNIDFLAAIGDKLSFLKKVEKEIVELETLEVYNYKLGIPRIVKMNQSMMLKALNGNAQEYNRYTQKNEINETNLERLKRVKEFVANTPLESLRPIVVFNDQNFIRDGQHRASILYNMGHKDIFVSRFIFNKSEYNISRTPLIDYIFRWNIKRLKSVYRFLKNKVKLLKRRIKYKLFGTI